MSKKRIIYVHPGDVVCLRVICDASDSADFSTWRDQTSAGRSGGNVIQFTVKNSDAIDLHNPRTDVFSFGKQRI